MTFVTAVSQAAGVGVFCFFMAGQTHQVAVGTNVNNTCDKSREASSKILHRGSCSRPFPYHYYCPAWNLAKS